MAPCEGRQSGFWQTGMRREDDAWFGVVERRDGWGILPWLGTTDSSSLLGLTIENR